MEPHIQLWLVIFTVLTAMFALGFVWGYWVGRNAKIAGVWNLEPIVRLPENE